MKFLFLKRLLWNDTHVVKTAKQSKTVIQSSLWTSVICVFFDQFWNCVDKTFKVWFFFCNKFQSLYFHLEKTKINCVLRTFDWRQIKMAIFNFQVSSGTLFKTGLISDKNFNSVFRDCEERYDEFVSNLKSFSIFCYKNDVDKLLMYGAK